MKENSAIWHSGLKDSIVLPHNLGVKVKVTQSVQLAETSWTIVHGILQARILELGSLSLLWGIFPTQELKPGLPHCGRFLYQLIYKGTPRILEWVASPLLQRIFPTQESNRGLLHCRQILYQLSYQGSPASGNLLL